MQEQTRDSIVTEPGVIQDSISLQPSLFLESRFSSDHKFHNSFYSKDIPRESIPDWYFFIIVLIIVGIAWIRMIHGKFLNSLFVSAYSYQAASKVFKEQSVVQKRFSLGLMLLYLINTSLFIFLLNRFFSPGIFESNEVFFVPEVFLFLLFLILLRIIIMRSIAFIFKQSELFLELLYHYFIFNKVLGILLIPFLITIPYTQEITQEIIVYTGILLVFVLQFVRLIRVAIFVMKNVVLLFYLILYLCILELLPVLVLIKLLLS
jgi:hypothetical protein